MGISKLPQIELAILGAAQRFKDPVHVNRPSQPDRLKLMALIEGVVDTDRYSNDGPLVTELEAQIADYLGVRNCVVTANGTLALQILMQSLELKGEVIVPSFTFIATAHSILWQGLQPVFCDVTPGTHNMDPEHCQSLITEATCAILGVHIWGVPCHIKQLTKLAQDNCIPLLFDAAHAFACGFEKRNIGNFGTAEVFSFHATKAFQTGEGGAITTNDDLLAQKLRLARNFGFIDNDETGSLGINAKMSELHAALGLANLSVLDNNLEKSRAIHRHYSSLLDKLPDLEIIQYQEPHNHQYVVAKLKNSTRLQRDELVNILTHEGILARRYFFPGCHRMQPYKDAYAHAPLYETEKLTEQCLVLPAGSNIEVDDVTIICEVIQLALDHSLEIKAHLKTHSN